MMRSRLRRPTSKSTTTTFWPVAASAAPRAAVVVVLPTPPLPDVTTMTLLMRVTSSIQGSDLQHTVFKPRLDRVGTDGVVPILGGPVIAVDRKQLGFVLAAE